MKIVIDIPEEVYAEACVEAKREVHPHQDYRRIRILRSICDGTPLPKGHGRLVDENDLVKDFNTFMDAFVINVAHGFELRVVCTAPTIVEADKEAEDG